MLLITDKQADFLKENRKDPITGDAFKMGDVIVFCADCKSAFHLSSWEYMGGRHCDQSEVLTAFPEKKALVLQKTVARLANLRANFNQRLIALLLDLVVFFFIFMVVIIIPIKTDCLDFFSEWFGYRNVTYLFVLIWFFRDAILMHAPGKRFLNLIFVNARSNQPASRLLIALRAFIYTLINITLYLIALYVFEPATTLLFGLHVINVWLLTQNRKAPIEHLLGIQLVQKERNTVSS